MPARTLIRLVPLAFAALLVACGSCKPPVPPTVAVPDALAPPPGETLQRTLWATGAQLYECRAKAGVADATEWAFIGPEATLADDRGILVGRHYAGPTWEANDGTKVVGTVKARLDAPEPGAIPWLLLETRSTGKGSGQFARVTSIQRVATQGGMPPPAAGCTSATLGQQARVDYKAQYVMFAPTF
jgi:hypothetical protein